MKKNLSFLTFHLFVILCFGLNAFAQDTTGDIQGVTKDTQGAIVPNVTLTVTGTSVGFNRTVQSDSEGNYRLRQVPPGMYRITAAAISGFAQQVKENILVNIGNATTIDFTLSTTVGATVDVTADNGAVVDTTTTQAQDNLSARTIETLPKGTGFASLLNRTSSLRSDAISGQFTVNGATGPENSFIIDGQEVQNFRTGTLNDANDIPFQSVQEIQVRTSGFEAEFGGATGGVINVVTKSGTNDWRGEVGVQFATQKFNSAARPVYNNLTGVSTPSGEFAELLPQHKDTGSNFYPTVSLGGPVVKNRVWFFGIYSPRYLSGTRQIDYFTALPPATRTLRGTVTTTAQSTQEYGFGRIDVSPTNNLRLMASYTWNPLIQNGLFPAGGTTLFATIPSVLIAGKTLTGADYFQQLGGRQNSNNFRSEAVWTPNSKIVTSLRFTRGFLNEKLNSYGITDIPRVQCLFTATSTQTVAQLQAQAGCASGFSTTTNNNVIRKDVSVRTAVDADASYIAGNMLGRHEFKGGYAYSKISNDVDTGFINTGRVVLCYGRFTGAGCLGFPTGSVSFNETTAPLGIGQIQRFGAFGNASNTAHTLFLQDKWQPTSRLTLNLGIRAEKEDVPAFNTGTIKTATNLGFDFQDKIAPRLGVAYALTNDGKTKLSAFYGWFYDRLKFELPRGSFGGNTYLVDTFIIDPAKPLYTNYTIQTVTSAIGSRPGGICPVPNAPRGTSVCQLDFRVPSNVPNLSAAFGPDVPSDAGTVDPNLKAFRQSEFTLEFQREVMRSSLLTVRYLYRNVDHAVEDAGFYTSNLSEFYDIANPCDGLHLKHIKQLGFERCVKPTRTYKALQMEFDTRFINNLNLNLSYTLSRLKGTYSGLANPDEANVLGVGRTAPGVTRLFDQPFVGYTAAGQVDTGVLPLDRPHVFKASGTYTLDWRNSKTNSTDLSFFTTVQSGTPQTTFVTAFEGITIPLTRRGDLGRTQTFTQTDLNFTHKYRFGRDNRFTLAVDFNVLNVLNESNIIGYNTQYDGLNWDFEFTDVSPNIVTAINTLTSRGVIDRINATQGTILSNPSHFNAGFYYPTAFQAPRTIRFGFRLIF